MKRSLPLMAVMAATLAAPLAAPVAAQDMSTFMNPNALAAHLGLGNRAAIAEALDLSMRAPSANIVQSYQGDVIASLTPETRSLAPRTSITPIPRGAIARVLAPAADVVIVAPEATAQVITSVAPTRAADMLSLMDAAADAAPEGSNTVVIAGTNTAVIQSGPAPRVGFWQRLFGN